MKWQAKDCQATYPVTSIRLFLIGPRFPQWAIELRVAQEVHFHKAASIAVSWQQVRIFAPRSEFSTEIVLKFI